MQYFVSIEDCQFFRWQLGLLLQSMADFGLEDSLIVACAELDKSLKPLSIPGAFYHENFGRNFGYLPLNKPLSLVAAIKSGLLTVPFTVLDPDMIMLKPVIVYDNFSQYCGYLDYKNLTSIGYDLKEYKKKWCPGGCAYVFQNCALEDVCRIGDLAIDIKNKYEFGLNSEVDRWQREMVAFAMLISSLEFSTRDDLVCTLNSNKDFNFIHYCNGFPPYFNKRIHNNLREFSFGENLPFDSIQRIPEKTKNISKFKRIAASFAKNATILN